MKNQCVTVFRIVIRHVARFRSTNGNISLLFGLLFMPMIGAVGLAVDFGFAISNRAAMQVAADAAVLSGAKAASTYLSDHGGGSAYEAGAMKAGDQAVQGMFAANAKLIGNITLPIPQSSTKFVDSAPTVVVTAQTNFKPFIMSIFGIKDIPINVSSTATLVPLVKYFQVIFLVDVSGSMTVGGDAATIKTMETIGSFRCAFACHDPNNLQQITAVKYADGSPTDWFVQQVGRTYCPYWNPVDCPYVLSTVWADKRTLAKLYGYKLKIDYVNSAISAFVSSIKDLETKNPGSYKVGINTFGSNADGHGNAFSQFFDASSDINAALLAAKKIDVEAVTPVQTTNWGYSYISVGLTKTLQSLRNVGDGSTVNKMKTYVVFLSDGVQDVPGYQIWGRGTNLNYTTACTDLKNSGVSVFSIWAPYYPIPDDDQYNILIKPLNTAIPAAMKNCASSEDQYFEASDGPGITNALSKSLKKIVEQKALRMQN